MLGTSGVSEQLVAFQEQFNSKKLVMSVAEVIQHKTWLEDFNGSKNLE
jgi:hypothetical protein